MSQVPPPYTPPPTPKNNGWAIASLILGIIGCIPFISGILAITFGILGIKKSNEPQTGGRGLAIAGLVLGIISFLGWVGFTTIGGTAFFAALRATAEPRAVATQFVKDVAGGNVSSAMTRCDDSIDRQDVQHASDTLVQLGAFKDSKIFGFNLNVSGVVQCEVSGTVSFDKGVKSFQATLKKEGDVYKIVKFNFQ
jgi:hypothetical protein